MLKPFVLAAAALLLGATAATAQTPQTRQQNEDEGAVAAAAAASAQSRTQGTGAAVRGQRPTRTQTPRAPQGPTPEEILAAVTPLAAAAAPNCQITESALLGAREDGVQLYEVACAAGPGYLLEAAATGPKANDCVLQWSFGQLAREADPAAEVGLQCTLPGNQNPVGVIAAYGRAAGLECDVDQAIASQVGTYEIGCAGRDGWRLQDKDGAWEAIECWRFALIADRACRFSTAEESRAEWPKVVAGTDAAACAVEDMAWMGDNPGRGSFYELKCSSGEGIIVRFQDGAGRQTYSCIDAPQIFNRPCELTTVAGPATPSAPTGGRA